MVARTIFSGLCVGQFFFKCLGPLLKFIEMSLIVLAKCTCGLVHRAFDIAGFEGAVNWIAKLLIRTLYAAAYAFLVIELSVRAVGYIHRPSELAAGMFRCTERVARRTPTLVLARGRSARPQACHQYSQ